MKICPLSPFSTRVTAFSLLTAFSLATVSSDAQESVGGQKLTALSRVARLKTLSARGKGFTAQAVYPVFRARTPLARFANAKLRSRIVWGFNAWVKSTQAQLEKEVASVPFDYASAPSTEFYATRRLISTELVTYAFEGGAHGMTVVSPLNFAVINGRAKALTLGDFFRSGTPYRKEVEAKIFAKLKKDPNAMWVQDGSVKTLETAQFNNFAAGRDGLRWVFNQYEMGPYAVGQFEIKLTANELGPDFRRDLLR